MAITLYVVTLLLTPFHSQPSCFSIECLNISRKIVYVETCCYT